jgi:hypothetical protein
VRDHGQVLALERLLPRQHLVEHDAEREDVGAVVDLVAEDALGRHVVRRAEQLPSWVRSEVSSRAMPKSVIFTLLAGR